jgi:hypothetical protein
MRYEPGRAGICSGEIWGDGADLAGLEVDVEVATVDRVTFQPADALGSYVSRKCLSRTVSSFSSVNESVGGSSVAKTMSPLTHGAGLEAVLTTSLGRRVMRRMLNSSSQRTITTASKVLRAERRQLAFASACRVCDDAALHLQSLVLRGGVLSLAGMRTS